MTTSGAAIHTSRDNITTLLNGTISTSGSTSAILLEGDTNIVQIGAGGGISNFSTSNASNGLQLFGSVGSTITNAGTIAAQTAIYLFNSPDTVINNTGLISSSRSGQFASVVYSEGSSGGDTSYTLNNAGTLMGGYSDGTNVVPEGVVAIFDASYSGFTGMAVRINNSGEVFGASYLNKFDDVIINSGTFQGLIDLFEGDDRYVGRGDGLVTGEVIGGAGNDTLSGSTWADLFDGGADSDRLVGNAGDDTLIGGAGSDTLFGGAGDDDLNGDGSDDTLFGGAGDDTMIGGSQNDLLIGGSGADEMRGGTQNDTLRGGDGNDDLAGQDGVDFLFGDNGNDTLAGGASNDFLRGGAGDDSLEGGTGIDDLRGGAGNDRLLGGLSADRLYGGPGADAFVFETRNDSKTGNIDNIFDFKSGEDVIDLESFVSEFTFVGTGAHTGGGTNSVRYIDTALGTSVRADVDGNGSSDLIITVRGLDVMTADDFIL